MTTKLKVGAVAAILLGMAALIIRHGQESARLTAETAALREQVVQPGSLREENLRLTEQLKRAVEASQAERGELLRLRAQTSRLRLVEQDNAQLRIEQQRLANQVAQAKPAIALPEQYQTVPASELKADGPRTNVTELGVVELSDRAPLRFNLGDGRSCVVTPTVLADGNIQMEIAVEAMAADGKSEQLGQSRLTARPGQQASISVGDRMIGLTPKLKP
jgi:Flp pilus assembly secretin CpaC